jgi:hypothetical protein
MVQKYFGSPEGLLIFGLIFINVITTSAAIILATQ